MNQWGFFFNQDRCLGCKACMTSCKMWNEERRGDADVYSFNKEDYMVAVGKGEMRDAYLNPDNNLTNYEEYRKFYMKEEWRRVLSFEKGNVVLKSDNTFGAENVYNSYLAMGCNHCDEPACVAACPAGIIYKEDSMGAVLTNPEACLSCGKCKEACPWDAPQFYDKDFARYSMDDPKRPKMTKCTFCVDRVTEGLKPMCVAACWNRALDAGPVEELKAKYLKKGYTLVDSIPGEFDKDSTDPNIIFQTKQKWNA